MSARLTNSYHSLQFILLQVIFILLARKSVICGFTNDTDQQALLAVKDLIPGDPFGVLSSWNHSLHFCRWRGVTCSHRHQRVTVLDLSSLSLVGSLSPQIGNLTFLRAIYFQNNSFHGRVPQEIGQLYRLLYFQLQKNSFQGKFPTNLSHCLDIRRIYLSENNLDGNIPTELGSLSNLLELDLSKNNLIGYIPPSIGNLSSLRVLDVGYNNLVGNIPRKLSMLSNLEILVLGHNILSGMFPLPLFNISSILELSLPGNQLQGTLPPDLGLTLPKLKGLLIGGNKFLGSFPPSIANASGIVKVDMSENSITGPLPMNLGSLGNLDSLILYKNKLATNRPNELSNLIKSLRNCSNLRLLDVGETGFKGDLPYSIVNLSITLTTLVMDSNNLSGTIPQEIGNLVNLMTIGLNGNVLSGSIPKSIGKLSKLGQLYLYTNNISGEIPTSVGNISQLFILNLGSNMLEGGIPATLGNVTNLQVLGLYNNRLAGVVPEQIFRDFSSIIAIRLSNNQLTGALPLKIGGLKNLGELQISRNRLTGEIPNTLGNCLMLEYLYMDDNLLQGTIPSSFKNLKSIQVLDLSHNNLSGQIPNFLGELPLFQKLNLSYNMFKGEVPTKGVFGNVSKFSVIKNLQLCGGIQALHLPVCHMKDLKKRRKSFRHVILPILIILPVVILVCLALIVYRLRRSKGQKPSISVLQEQYPRLSYGELLQATNGFSLTNLIGQGRYSSVYKGILSSEQVVAVKVLNVELRGANTSFFAECETFRNIRHRNLLKIITSCSSIDFKGSDFRALVLEFMPKGSLDSWLHPDPFEQQNNKRRLTLLQRLNISIDVAAALDYLHRHCETRIVHCDVKPSNVLLDEEFVAHVGDFGLAKFLLNTTSDIHPPQTSSIGIRGTIGYVPPEYGMNGEASPKGDVYSYGILLLEMFSGKRPTDNMFVDGVNLCNYVRKGLAHKVMEVVDPRVIMPSEDDLTTQSNSTSNISKMESCLISVFEIGILCCAERPSERKNITDVLKELTVIRNSVIGITR